MLAVIESNLRNTPMKTTRAVVFACLLLLAGAGPVSAGESSAALLGSYWSSFVDHWQRMFQQQDGITVGIILVGLLALFIITRGKWVK
jgi:hypothetical protein